MSKDDKGTTNMSDSINETFSRLPISLIEVWKKFDQEEPPQRPNVLVCGYTGSGKTTLIKSILGDVMMEDAAGAGIPHTKGFLFYENEDKSIAIYDSQGSELGQKFDDFRKSITEFIADTHQDEYAGRSIHLIWYGIDGSLGRIQPFDREFIKSVSRIAPVIVVILKNDITKEDTRQEFKKILIEKEGIPQERVVFTSGKTENPDNGCRELVAESIKLLPEACRLKFIRSQICDVQSKIDAEMGRILKAATRPLIDIEGIGDKINEWIKAGKDGTAQAVEWISERIPGTETYKKKKEELLSFKKKVYVAGAIMTTFLLILWRVLGCLQEGHYSLRYIGFDVLAFTGSILVAIGAIILCVFAFLRSKILGGVITVLTLTILGVLAWMIGEHLVAKGFPVAYVLIGCLKYLVFFLVPACLIHFFLMIFGSRFEDYYAHNKKKLPHNFYGACRCWTALTAGWIDITKEAWGILRKNPVKAFKAAWNFFWPWS